MVTIRNANEIIASLIDFFRLVQPDLDTKPGTVARDLFVDAPAAQLSLLYDELSGVSDKQSLRLVTGTDLDKLARNFGLSRKQPTPSLGVALLTFSSINAPINIDKGDIILATNGLSFTVTVGVAVNPSASNFYKSLATKYANQLSFVGITDPYAVEVTVSCTSPGAIGNIGQYGLSSTTISGVSNVTNINAFQGGTDQESDALFRNRILSSFSGSSVGTTLGYLNTALSTTGVIDAAVIGPGNPLMTRDGTVTEKINGVLTIVQEGSGGKVDVVVLGNNEVQTSDTFVYTDKSNSNDPTSPKNDFVLGQIAADANKTVFRKRIDDLKNGVVPSQPVDAILQVTGSKSGSNFVEKTVDANGIVSGNYELFKDTGVYGGSPWGFDTFKWISNKISDFQEDRVKGQPYGQDTTTYTDVTEVHDCQQNLPITNENSIVTSDRSIIQLLHFPATNVTRVFNVNTGERYLITNQNLDQTTPFNSTGRIQISGNTLPATSDVLQVDYTWVVDFDQYSDFDGLVNTTNSRPATDTIDWGYGSLIRSEIVQFSISPGNNYYQGTTSHPVSTIVEVDQFLAVDGYVQTVTAGAFVDRLSVIVTNLAAPPTSVDSITLKNSNVEVYNTAQADGSFSNASIVVGINVLSQITIILPHDTAAQDGDRVTVYMNSLNVFESGTTAQGTSNGTQVTVPTSLLATAADTLNLKVVYIANVTDLYSAATNSLPTSRAGNGYLNGSNNGFQNFSIVNTSRRENQVVQLNLSNQFYTELNLPFADYTLLTPNVLSVIRLSDGYQLWTTDNPGSIFNATDGNYQLILPGYGNPLASDRVLAVYYASDIRRFQPFSYSNTIIKTRVDNLGFDPITRKWAVPLVSFVTQLGSLQFQIRERDSDVVLFSVTDGVLTVNIDGTANITSATNFSSLPDLTNKVVRIVNADNVNNNGTYDILSYDVVNNFINITTVLDNISADQVSVIRVSDGQELWNYNGTIDVANNRLLIPVTLGAAVGDFVYVMFFNYRNLRKSPTRLISTTLDQIVNPGVITVFGTTLFKADEFVFTVTTTGLKQNLQEAMRKALNLNSTATIPTNIKIAKVINLEKVITLSPNDDTVLEVLTTFDVKNSTIANNLYYADEMLGDSTLNPLEFVLPSTTNNTLTGAINNLPTLGDKLRVTFYYTVENDSENLTYTRNGTLYTNKKFALINKIFTSSGFKSSQGTRFTATSFTQPSLGGRFKAFYDYLAPKQNERIVISYNYNKLVADATFNIESTRPINADVIVRAAKEVLLDLTMNVVISSTFQTTSQTVLQNLRSALVTALTTTQLGQTIDQPTLINTAQAVQGVARARILHFNENGKPGQVLSITANGDQYFLSNNIIINTETR